MRDNGDYCDENPIDVECLKYCFMRLLREELYHAAQHWNLHQIRPTRNQDSPSGRPDLLYFVPESVGVTDCKVCPNHNDVAISKELVNNEQCPSEEMFCELAEDEHLHEPQNAHKAKVLYQQLLLHIDRL